MHGDQNQELNDLLLLLESGSEQELRRFLNLLQREELLELLYQAPNNPELRRRLLSFYHPSDLAELLTLLPEKDWTTILEPLDAEQLSGLLTELEVPEVGRILQHIQENELPMLISGMDSDDAADILGELPQHRVSQILEQLPDEDAVPLKKLLAYKDDTAGGLMQTELLRVQEAATIEQAINAVREQAEQEDDFDIYEIYVIDEQDKLTGQFSLERLILSDTQTPVQELIEPDLHWVTPEVDQEEVAEVFQKYDLISLPVVDHERRLLGRITVDDIVDVIKEEASEDILQFAGASSKDLTYDRTFQSVYLRLPWLVTNLLGGLLTGYMMWLFRATLTEIIALITFVPVITGMGGNVGTQSSSITVRGFALGRIGTSNIKRYLLKEMRVGALMGIICGLSLSVICLIWHANLSLGFVVGLSLFVAMTVAATMGTLVPTLFQALRIDPALASGPFVTTFNDITGILIYFTTATIFITWLK